MIKCTFEDGAKASLRHVTVDVLVVKNDEILLAKRSRKLLFEGGKWGIIGGFMERDETAPQGAAREVLEETGWQIKNLRLLTIKDSPDRPAEDRQNISFVFFAEAIEKTGEPDWESEEVKWFPLNDLPPNDQVAFDHADLIELYKRYLKENLSLPLLAQMPA